MITITRLDAKQYEELLRVGDGFVPDPARSIAIVARNDAKVIGRLFAIAPTHVEGIYIEPAWRGRSLFKDLMAAMEVEARAEGIRKLFAYAVDREIGSYIDRRCGYAPLPWTVHAKEIA